MDDHWLTIHAKRVVHAFINARSTRSWHVLTLRSQDHRTNLSGKGSGQKAYIIGTILMNESEATYIYHNGDLLLSMDKTMWFVSADGKGRNDGGIGRV